MAIRFFCQRCNQLLGIASRKAGTEIQCPKCGLPQIVPTEEAATASLAMMAVSESAMPVETASSVVVYDDEPAAIESPRQQRKATPASVRTSLSVEPDMDQPGSADLIVYRRHTLYMQGVLFLVLGAIAFGAGYFVGRGDASFDLQVAREEATKERVLIEGKLVYSPAIGELAGDEDAVIIVLPEKKLPEHSLSIRGLRPQDPAPGENYQQVRKIEDLGGTYTRADASGVFSCVVPQQGKYYLLFISHHAARPEDSTIDELDLEQMKKYFGRADDLINRYKYSWKLQDLNVGSQPISHEFGRDGEA